MLANEHASAPGPALTRQGACAASAVDHAAVAMMQGARDSSPPSAPSLPPSADWVTPAPQLELPPYPATCAWFSPLWQAGARNLRRVARARQRLSLRRPGAPRLLPLDGGVLEPALQVVRVQFGRSGARIPAASSIWRALSPGLAHSSFARMTSSAVAMGTRMPSNSTTVRQSNSVRLNAFERRDEIGFPPVARSPRGTGLRCRTPPARSPHPCRSLGRGGGNEPAQLRSLRRDHEVDVLGSSRRAVVGAGERARQHVRNARRSTVPECAETPPLPSPEWRWEIAREKAEPQ